MSLFNIKNIFRRSSNMENICYDDSVPFIPPISKGKVVKVYDGDTFTIACPLVIDGIQTKTIYRFSVRIKGIDTPEIKTKNIMEKSLANIARGALCSKIENKVVELKNVETEKYGRILADVFVEGIDIGKWMLDSKHAVYYNGGTKQIPDEWTNIC
jgi:micrococcal nuclease